MPYNAQGEWSIWDLGDTQDIALDPVGDSWREPPEPQPMPAFDGHISPSVFKSDAGHTESGIKWIPEKRELRLFIARGIVGQFITKDGLREIVGRETSNRGEIRAVSLVFNPCDISANCEGSMNLRSNLALWGFKRDNSFSGHGLCFAKDLTMKQEAPPTVAPKPPQPKTAEEWAQRYKDEGLTVLPPSLQRDLEHEQRMKQDAETDLNRLLEIKKAEIERLQALKDSQAEKPCPQ